MTATAAKPDIGHNSASVGEILDERPAALFEEPSMLQALLDEGERSIAEFKVDLSTEKGRKAIASFARKFATRKTSLDEAGKEMNSSLRKKIDVVDELRRKLRDGLDKQRDKARAPLDAWEQAEDDRKTSVIEIRQFFADALRPPADATIADIDRLIRDVEGTDVFAGVFLDLTEQVDGEKSHALISLRNTRDRIVKAEADRIELERLRAEKEEAERLARERAAKEAAERAEQERIAATAKRAAEEAVEAERRKAQAEADAARAEQAKALAAAEEARRQEAAKAQMAIDEANRKAREAEAALEAERRAEAAKAAAVAKAKADQEAADRERQRNQEHRSKIMGAAKQAMMDHCEVTEAVAKKIVLAIVAGSIPNVSLEF